MPTDKPTHYQPPPVPLCLHCLQPHHPLLHYCPKCGSTIGHFTPNIPFVNIRFQCEFWGKLWHKLWSPQPGYFFTRVMAIVLILLVVPILFLGLPFVLFNRRRSEKHGFEVLSDTEQHLAASSHPTPSPDLPQNDQPPAVADRPPLDPPNLQSPHFSSVPPSVLRG